MNFYVKPERPKHDLLVIMLEARDMLDANFKKVLSNFTTQIAECMKPLGPTLVIVVTNLEGLEDVCGQSDTKIDAALKKGTRTILKFMIECMDRDNGNTESKLPMITCMDLKDSDRFMRVTHKIANLLVDGK